MCRLDEEKRSVRQVESLSLAAKVVRCVPFRVCQCMSAQKWRLSWDTCTPKASQDCLADGYSRMLVLLEPYFIFLWHPVGSLPSRNVRPPCFEWD